MALPFFQQRKRQKYLNWIFIIAVLIGALWFGQNYLFKPLSSPPLTPKEKKVEINLEILEKPILQELQPFEEIPPFEGDIGRENPFLPY
ncbi:MAG TPA: hypothetical protein ENI19_00455 [Candidatus Nealsonbacteria bacterium]|uniref:Uncharacterized protein n=1 Tax=marine sediment metagenome TaxID=412755 RepID=A0A0F9UWD9_9ZZZZ|nr:hypothetical protein [Candidatus Nealsonbacteria bacterium]HEB46162.1 hypothetical protein [Candidatus Nealsonbacteria bacterium]